MSIPTATPRNLEDWLRHAENVHTVGIDMGLGRVGEVAGRMGLTTGERPPAPRSVIVAGTNGKGSTCLALETILRAAGCRVGTTLSPHVHVFNERVRIDGELATDAMLCAAFAAVESARGSIPLTYFEFSALVALDCFRTAGVDTAILEVGLGGRLDAFNIVDADLAIITSIGVDHEAYLGSDPEGIGREKAGVLRQGQRVVLGQPMSDSVLARARQLDCRVTRLGRQFHVHQQAGGWSFESPGQCLSNLPWGALAPQNCALALEAAGYLAGPSSAEAAGQLAAAHLPGRFEHWQVSTGCAAHLLIVDVAHNPAGAGFLCQALQRRYPKKRFVAVAAMLADKDSAGVGRAMGGLVDQWVCLPSGGPRGLPAADLARRLSGSGAVTLEEDTRRGLDRALSLCAPGDGILAFGSFDLVEKVRGLLLRGYAGAQACRMESVDGVMDQRS